MSDRTKTIHTELAEAWTVPPGNLQIGKTYTLDKLIAVAIKKRLRLKAIWDRDPDQARHMLRTFIGQQSKRADMPNKVSERVVFFKWLGRDQRRYLGQELTYIELLGETPGRLPEKYEDIRSGKTRISPVRDVPRTVKSRQRKVWSREEREKKLDEQEGYCAILGIRLEPGDVMLHEMDHFEPVSPPHNGSDDWFNMRLVYTKANNLRGAGGDRLVRKKLGYDSKECEIRSRRATWLALGRP